MAQTAHHLTHSPHMASIDSCGLAGGRASIKGCHLIGISQSQLRSFEQHLLAQLQGLANNAILFLSNIFSFTLDVLLIALLSIYFLITGPRMTDWLRHKTPVEQRGHINFLLDTLERVIGGNFRGVLLLATVISTIK